MPCSLTRLFAAGGAEVGAGGADVAAAGVSVTLTLAPLVPAPRHPLEVRTGCWPEASFWLELRGCWPEVVGTTRLSLTLSPIEPPTITPWESTDPAGAGVMGPHACAAGVAPAGEEKDKTNIMSGHVQGGTHRGMLSTPTSGATIVILYIPLHMQPPSTVPSPYTVLLNPL